MIEKELIEKLLKKVIKPNNNTRLFENSTFQYEKSEILKALFENDSDFSGNSLFETDTSSSFLTRKKRTANDLFKYFNMDKDSK